MKVNCCRCGKQTEPISWISNEETLLPLSKECTNQLDANPVTAESEGESCDWI